MKRDVRSKTGASLPYGSKLAKRQLVRLLKLVEEMETGYLTYPKLRAVVGEQAWQSLTDVAYRQTLELNLDRRDHDLAARLELNLTRLEDIVTALLVRDQTGLRDVLSRVLMYRLANGLAKEAR
jgi:hypothetical protein